MKNPDEVEILLVEDSKNDRELILRSLKKNNITSNVFTAKNGEEALEYIFATAQYERDRHLLPKVVLLDLKLPKMNGFEVLKAIKSDERTRIIPVVIFTSSQEEKDKLESYKLGSNSFVVKPIKYENFVQAVSEIGHYWLSLNMASYRHE